MNYQCFILCKQVKMEKINRIIKNTKTTPNKPLTSNLLALQPRFECKDKRSKKVI